MQSGDRVHMKVPRALVWRHILLHPRDAAGMRQVMKKDLLKLIAMHSVGDRDTSRIDEGMGIRPLPAYLDGRVALLHLSELHGEPPVVVVIIIIIMIIIIK